MADRKNEESIKGKMSATHEITVIRRDGTREKVFDRELNPEETQTLFKILSRWQKQQQQEESDGTEG